MLDAIGNKIRSGYRAWLDRRIPPARSATLNQRKIFIFPSRPGLWFLLLLLLMLLAAINYQNNMAFALVFLLASVFVVSILHTFANMSGLSISAISSVPAFVGERVEFELSVSRVGDKEYFDVILSWPESDRASVSLIDNDEQSVHLFLPAKRRGLMKLDRLRVETVYPVGLLRSWSLLALDLDAIVYPRPEACELIADSANDGDQGEAIEVAGSDDFYGFNEYQPGDAIKHVFWKAYAKGQKLQTKQFSSCREQRLWLDWQQFSGDSEERLSKLCYWVLKSHRDNNDYGLRLPSVEIAPDHGERHQKKILRELALFKADGLVGDVQ